jgi:hypothetical protein
MPETIVTLVQGATVEIEIDEREKDYSNTTKVLQVICTTRLFEKFGHEHGIRQGVRT